ncbi:hypothetical protein HK105_207145 [Polyrhizophydium stewartii]|uniref:F-box domain-containing protein n=1 Tax=Polyrhizophydium stewartii TaxID=2732419 RepID=A0ABR4N1K2_9FUNG
MATFEEGLSALLLHSHAPDAAQQPPPHRGHHTAAAADTTKAGAGDTSGAGGGGGRHITSLPFDVCVLVLARLPLPAVAALARTCRFWRRIVANRQAHLVRQHMHGRFLLPPADTRIHQRRLDNDPAERSWLAFYQRLDRGEAGWHGLAMDPVTQAFEPYCIELALRDARVSTVGGIVAAAVGAEAAGPAAAASMRRARLTELGGCCRFRSLNDALTAVEATIVDDASVHQGMRFELDPVLNGVPRLAAFGDWVGPASHAFMSMQARNVEPPPPPPQIHMLRPVVFEETQILRGTDLAVPNRYHGFTNGFVMFGMFDPGDAALLGVFCVVLEDTMPYSAMLPRLVARTPSGSSPGDTAAGSPASLSVSPVAAAAVAASPSVTGSAASAGSASQPDPPVDPISRIVFVGRTLRGYLAVATQRSKRAAFACHGVVVQADPFGCAVIDVCVNAKPLAHTCMAQPAASASAGAVPPKPSADPESAGALHPPSGDDAAAPRPLSTTSSPPAGAGSSSAQPDTAVGAASYHGRKAKWLRTRMAAQMSGGSVNAQMDKPIVLTDVQWAACDRPETTDHLRGWIARHMPLTPFSFHLQGGVWIGMFRDPVPGVVCLF